ncbi:uncharacterized protein LOC127288456 isoform X1 [Leptopilina boulardi]|uniref:uncharacterized protein LOC127288456 isoform X1 n=1 Tax=Leptopilina boulardi TaxID=63433 RepID=UPI0021F5B612|nr:uncharacterized protein LOC127288456 isoform X1 [Leptopilina boulardi]
MKSALLLLFLASAALQVDFALSTVESRIEQLNELWYRAHIIYKNVKEFKENEVDSRRDKINNQTISLLEEVTSLTQTTHKQIENLRNFSCYQEEADTYAAEDENINVDLCLDAAVNQLKYIIVYDCGSFGTCRNRSEVEIKTIIKELIQYIKVMEETKMTIIYVRDVACQNLTGYAQELCLYCRIPQIEVQVVTYEKKVQRFTKRALTIIEQVVQTVNKCLTDSSDKAKDKINNIVKETKECFAQLCNNSTTTVEPPTTSTTTEPITETTTI